MTYINREKFKTELGKQVYDILKPISPHEDWLFLMLMLTKGDEKKQILLDFIAKGERDWGEIHKFVMEKWGVTHPSYVRSQI